MKHTFIKLALFLFALALMCSVFSCKKKKTRSAVYTCDVIQVTPNQQTQTLDTTIIQSTVFEYWNGTLAELDSTVSHGLDTSNHYIWVDCY